MAPRKPRIFLTGAFGLEDRHGRRIWLSSAKAQGLLALLATSEKGERSRAWLQSILWSDRAPDQASGSLRQTLTLLRKTLNPIGATLRTDRQRVALDLDSLEIIEREDSLFLEGLDVRDQEFEAWLRDERLARDARNLKAEAAAFSIATLPAASDFSIAVLPQDTEMSADLWFGNLFSDAISRSLREVFSCPVSVGKPPPTSNWLITAKIDSKTVAEGLLMVRVVLEHPAIHHQLFAGSRTVSFQGAPPIDHPELLRLVNELVEALSDYLILSGFQKDHTDQPDALCRFAIRSLFTMNKDRLLEADQKFKQAFEMGGRGLYLAWRAQLRAIQSVELHRDDVDALIDEGRYFCERALELEPNNSMVLATLSNAIRRFSRDDQRSIAMAKRSVRLNPGNPMAWHALSAAFSYVDDLERSYDAIIVAQRLALLSPERFWWDNQRFGPAMLQGQIGEAIKFAEQTHLGKPNFRPPLRYLIALYASEGRQSEALEAAERLKMLEPDFSIERLIKDDTYPASLVHRIPGMKMDRLSDLI